MVELMLHALLHNTVLYLRHTHPPPCRYTLTFSCQGLASHIALLKLN